MELNIVGGRHADWVLEFETKQTKKSVGGSPRVCLKVLTEMMREVDESYIWINYCESIRMCNEHLIKSGIYENLWYGKEI